MRLIDADDLEEILDIHIQKLQDDIDDARTEVQKVVYEAQLFSTMEMIRVIKEQPTAYNVDKVVKELKTLSQRACNRRNLFFSNKEYERGRVYAFDDAIDIVKAGGIDE